MKFAKKVRGFSMPQMIASVAIASVLTAVGANYYWDIVEEASTVGDSQSIEVVRDTLALTMNDVGVIHQITPTFVTKANARVSGLSSSVGNAIIAKTDSAATPTMSSWWYVMAFTKEDKTKAEALAARLDTTYDGVTSGVNGQVVYDITCTAAQSSTPTVGYSDCFIAFNLMRSPNAGAGLQLAAADIISLKVSHKQGDGLLFDTVTEVTGSALLTGFVLN